MNDKLKKHQSLFHISLEYVKSRTVHGWQQSEVRPSGTQGYVFFDEHNTTDIIFSLVLRELSSLRVNYSE